MGLIPKEISLVPGQITELTVIRKGICQKLNTDLNQFVTKLDKISDKIQKDLKLTKKDIFKTSFSPKQKIQEAVDKIKNNLDKVVPNFTDDQSMQELIDIIRTCTCFGNDPRMCDPVNLARALRKAFLDSSNDVLNSLVPDVPELNLGIQFQGLDVGFGKDGLNLENAIPGIDNIIACINKICGTDIGPQVKKIDDDLDKMFVSSTFGFSTDSFLNSIDNLDAQAKDNISKMSQTAISIGCSVLNAVDKGVNFLDLMKSNLPELCPKPQDKQKTIIPAGGRPSEEDIDQGLKTCLDMP